MRDDGKIMTSRNGSTEVLYGLDVATQEEIVSTQANAFHAVLNASGALKKTVDLEPWDQGGDDLIYGGLGDDFLHGGAGQDGISGAEALAPYYEAPSDWRPTVGEDGRLIAPEGFYDVNNALQKIEGHALNFDATEGDIAGVDGATPKGDGEDRIFGDLGDDWLVGGTGRDHLWGGLGGDIINADDNLDTNGGANDAPDEGTHPISENGDLVFGGGGRDMMIANTAHDRMIDWAGEYNNFVVPFSPFGNWTVVRSPAPWIQDFLVQVAESDGTDPTRLGEGGDPDRLGEPFGELGMVTQQDDGWQDQTGAPDGQQPGNSHGQRDGRGIEPAPAPTETVVTASATTLSVAAAGDTTGTGDTGGGTETTLYFATVDTDGTGEEDGLEEDWIIETDTPPAEDSGELLAEDDGGDDFVVIPPADDPGFDDVQPAVAPLVDWEILPPGQQKKAAKGTK